MAEVQWQARRVSDSVLVDVTADISGTAQSAPTQNAIESGGVQTVRLLGPYVVNYDHEDIGVAVIDLGAIDEGLLVLNTMLLPTIPWNQSQGNIGTADSLWAITIEAGEDSANIAEYSGPTSALTWAEWTFIAGVGHITKWSAIVPANATIGFWANPSEGTFTSGQATIYLLVAEPSA